MRKPDNTITRPMKGESIVDSRTGIADFSVLKFPVIVSPKLDGIRCIRPHGRPPLAASFKPIANHHIREVLTEILPFGFDGEIVLPGKSYNDIQSEVMSYKGEPEFKFRAFDYIQGDLQEPFESRIRECENKIAAIQQDKYIKIIPHYVVHSVEELEEFETTCLNQGFEGVMIRKPEGGYKNGRSTLKQGLLLKLKRFIEDEGVIIGFVEKMRNDNEKKVDALGLSKRSSHQEGMTPTGTLGAFILDWNGRTLRVGGGLTGKERRDYWECRDSLMGKLVTFKYQPYGMKDLPRIASFRGIRKDI